MKKVSLDDIIVPQWRLCMTKRKIIMKDKEIKRAISRMAHEIIERVRSIRELVIIGIQTRGVFLAKRLCKEIKKIEKKEIPFGILDITLYRDDVGNISHQPLVKETRIPFDITNKKIVLVDDVLFAGRTVRAALDEIMDFGRPRIIYLAVLIDRGNRELPIQADFIGKFIPTSKKEKIAVHLREIDKKDEVILEEMWS